MKTARKTTLLSLLVVCCLVVFGCGKKEGAGDDTSTENKSAGKLEADAGKMDADQLRAAALECKAAIEAKTAETGKLAQGLIKALSTDNADKREELNAQMKELRKSEEALYEQFKVYIDKLKEKGGDMSGLES